MIRRKEPATPEVALWIADAIGGLPALCTVDEAIGVLRLSRRHFYRLTSTGRVNAIKTSSGGRLLVPRTELARYLKSMGAA